MALQISGIASVLKKVIIPTIQDQLPKQSVLFDKIKKNSGVTMANNQIYISARTGRHSGIYSVAEGTQPGVGSSTFSNPYTSVKYSFGTLEISDQALEAAKDNAKAIASILSSEIKALTSDFRKDINRQWFGDGTGQLCLANGTGANVTTLTVDSPGTRYLCPGMQIEIGTSGATTISTVDSATQVTLLTAATWANNDKVTKLNDDEMMGLKGLVDDGDYVATCQAIVRSSNAWAKSQVEDTAATLTEAHMIDLYLKCLEYGKPSVVFAGPHGFSKYGQLLTSMKRTADLKEVLSGGWKGLEFMGGDAGVMLDYDVPEVASSEFMLFMVDFDTFTIAEMTEPFKFMEAEAGGGILRRSSSNRTVWEATLKYYANLVCKNFQANGRLDKKQK
jgi:hypothetical protein